MKWLMAIPVWSTPRDSLNRFNLVFSRCPYEESPLRVPPFRLCGYALRQVVMRRKVFPYPRRFLPTSRAAPAMAVIPIRETHSTRWLSSPVAGVVGSVGWSGLPG